MAGVVLDLPPLVDVVRDHGTRPDHSMKARAAWPTLDYFPQQQAFVGVEFPRPTGSRFGFEAPDSSRSKRAQPFLDGLVGASHAARHGRELQAVVGQENCAATVGRARLAGAAKGLRLLFHEFTLGPCQRNRGGRASHEEGRTRATS